MKDGGSFSGNKEKHPYSLVHCRSPKLGAIKSIGIGVDRTIMVKIRTSIFTAVSCSSSWYPQ